MPFKSVAQMCKFYGDPKLLKYANEFAKGTDFKKLPDRVKKTKPKTKKKK